jgi:alkylation response protein AidB-like acyl-CoA dehydrogenase
VTLSIDLGEKARQCQDELRQRFAELTLNIGGAKATIMADQKPDEYEPDHWQSNFFATRSVTIWGGTAQVQRNIVGERVLGLPKEPFPVQSKGGAQ